MSTKLTNITYKVPSCGIVLADRKDAESVSAGRQSPDQMASRCRVRIVNIRKTSALLTNISYLYLIY